MPRRPGDDRLKVGIVVPYSWSFWGGVQEHADHQARALAEHGVDVRLITGHDPPGRLTNVLHPRRGRDTPLPPYVVPVGRSVIVPANGSLPNIVISPNAMLRMKRLFARERFDVLHVHEPITPLIAAYALANAPCPLVATFHAAGEELRWYPGAMRMWGFLLARVDHAIAVSEPARRVAERFVGRPVEVIPNGVALPADPDPGGRERRVVFVGRHEPRKGLEVLLRAWPEVAARTGARLRVVGADPLSVRWLLRRKRLSGDAVDLLGGVAEESLTRELRAASVLAAPSLGGESFGMVLTRAFACATPVVASDIEGYSEVVEPDTGVLVPPGDERALAAALVDLLEDEPRRRALGAAARRVAEERYAWDRIVERLLLIYGAVTGAPVQEREVVLR
jgi:phosphatidylinositol alpha-mannosyltransferase